MIYCLTANTKGGASVARVGRSPAGRAFCAARAFKKIRPAPSARAADRGQALFESMEAAVVGRGVIEGAPRCRRSTRSGSADQEQQHGAALSFFMGSPPGGACPAMARPPSRDMGVLALARAFCITMFLFCSVVPTRMFVWLANLQPSDARRRPSPPCQSPLRRRAALRDVVSPMGRTRGAAPPRSISMLPRILM